MEMVKQYTANVLVSSWQESGEFLLNIMLFFLLLILFSQEEEKRAQTYRGKR